MKPHAAKCIGMIMGYVVAPFVVMGCLGIACRDLFIPDQASVLSNGTLFRISGTITIFYMAAWLSVSPISRSRNSSQAISRRRKALFRRE